MRRSLPIAQGYGVALLASNASFPSDPVEPNASGVFGVGFDTFNPRPFGSDRNKWFGPEGNFYDRPQREISLHWNGREIANRLCPVSVTDASGHDARLLVEYVCGGAEVTVAVNGVAVYDRFFVPELFSQPRRFEIGGTVKIERLRKKVAPPIRIRRVPPVTVVAFDKAAERHGTSSANQHRALSRARRWHRTRGSHLEA